jgi:hypothetical protein
MSRADRFSRLCLGASRCQPRIGSLDSSGCAPLHARRVRLMTIHARKRPGAGVAGAARHGLRRRGRGRAAGGGGGPGTAGAGALHRRGEHARARAAAPAAAAARAPPAAGRGGAPHARVRRDAGPRGGHGVERVVRRLRADCAALSGAARRHAERGGGLGRGPRLPAVALQHPGAAEPRGPARRVPGHRGDVDAGAHLPAAGAAHARLRAARGAAPAGQAAARVRPRVPRGGALADGGPGDPDLPARSWVSTSPCCGAAWPSP